MKQHAVTTNFLLNVAGAILPILTALAIVPLYINVVGAERYGMLAIVWLLLGYFGFLDFGLSRASANALSKLGHADASRRGPVLVTALYLNAVLGLVGGLLLYVASGLLLERFANLTPELAVEVTAAMPWVAAMLPVALVSSIGAGAIESREQFLAANLFQTFGGVFGQVVPVVCAILFGPSLAVVVPAALLARLVSTLLIWAFVLHAERPVNFRCFDRAKVRELAGYGAWVSISSLLSPLLATFDQFLIGALIGPTAIAHYSVPMSLSTRTQVVALALAKTLFPRLSRLEPVEARLLASRAIVTLAFGFGAICGPAILLAGPFLQHWIGAEFAVAATPVAQILLVGAWANGIAFIPYALLQGQGRPDLSAKIHAAEVVPFLTAVYLLTINFGLPGAALAWTLRMLVDCAVMLRVGQCWTGHLVRILPALGGVVACYSLAHLWPTSLASSVGLAGLMGVAITVCALVVDSESRGALRRLTPAVGRLRLRFARAQRMT